MATYRRLRPLTAPRDEDLDGTFQRLAEQLRDSGQQGTLQCTILGSGEPRRWVLNLSGRECRVQTEPVAVPNLEIITDATTWWAIAAGTLSPLDAFAQGRLRVLGDTRLGSHLLALAGDGRGAASICGEA